MAKKKKEPQQALSPQKYLKEKARNLPIAECFINKNWKEIGETIVAVSRRHKQGTYTLGLYMVDTFCRGVYDTQYQFNIEESRYRGLIDHINNGNDMIAVEYVEAHNLIYGAVAFAEEAGIEPSKAFELTSYILEEDTNDIPLLEYEFGKEGKHSLVANSKFEASQYLPALKKNLGDDFTYSILQDTDEDEDEEESDLTDFDNTELMEAFAKLMEHNKLYPLTDYSYSHPDYPMEMNLENEHLYMLFCDPDFNTELPKEITAEVLSYPHDSLIRDLEQMALFETGCTCDEIPPERLEGDYYSLLLHTLFFLGEVHGENSLNVVLETLRQNPAYYEFHFGDSMNEVFIPTLYLLGRDRLPDLLDYIKEPGLYTFARYLVFPAVALVAHKQPERRDEVLEWFRQVLVFYTDNADSNSYFDGSLSGMMMHDLINLEARELLPEIEALFQTGKVDPHSSGDYKQIEKELSTNCPEFRIPDKEYAFDIYERYQQFEEQWG